MKSGGLGFALAAEGGPIGTSRSVLLKPEEWVNKQFPLIEYIDVGSELSTGQWVVVLYRQNCAQCQEELPRYERLAAEQVVGGPDAPRVAVVEVPERRRSGEQRVGNAASFCLQGRLSDEREWYVKTPVVLHLQDGQVTRCQRQ